MGDPAEPGGPGTDLRRAHRHLRTALALASPHRYLATIIEQAPGVTVLLRSLPADTSLMPYVDELSVRAEAVTASSRGPAALPPGGFLSGRELEVLRLLASRLTTTEIAGALFVSPNTLKSHMKNIYRKLDVSSRAVQSARVRPSACSDRAASIGPSHRGPVRRSAPGPPHATAHRAVVAITPSGVMPG